MSGIVNSAGSRSGVIGTTELDYEEGTFTATARFSTGTPTITANYTKIGRVVTFSIVISNIASNGTTNEFSVGGLPFTCLADTPIVIGPTYNINSPVATMNLRSKISGSQVYCPFYWSVDDSAYSIATCANFDAADAGISLSGSYQI